jgi:hypothetical protein
MITVHDLPSGHVADGYCTRFGPKKTMKTMVPGFLVSSFRVT